MRPPLTRPLSDRFDAALVFAHRVHREQARKGPSQIPYIAHLLGVTSLVLDYGGSETQAIAALLHDAIEDAPPEVGADAVRRIITYEFGREVAQIVEHCTDTDEQPKPAWLERKQRYVESLSHAPEHALLVSAADKLHNVNALTREYRLFGEDLWDRFNKDAGRSGTLGYYRALQDAFAIRLRNPIVQDLDRAMTGLENAAGGRCAWPPSAHQRRG